MRIGDYFRMVNSSLLQHKLRTGLTVLSVIIGAVAVLLVLASVLTVRSVLSQQLEAYGVLTRIIVTSQPNQGEGPDGGGPQRTVEEDEGGKTRNPLTPALAKKIRSIPHVVAVSPEIGVHAVESVYLKGGPGRKFRVDSISAVEVNAAGELPVQAGRFVKPGETGAIVLSSAYLAAFGFEDRPDALVGRDVILEGHKGASLGKRPAPPEPGEPPNEQGDKVERVPATVVGVATGGPLEGVSYVSLEWGITLNTQYTYCDEGPREGPGGRPCGYTAQDPLARDGYNVINVRVDSVENVAPVAEAVEALGVHTVTVQEMLDSINVVLVVVGMIVGGIGAVSLLVATIGIINTMIMAAYERRREIGVMRATGASRRTVLSLFTLEAGMIGFWGGAIGLVIALVVQVVGNRLLNSALSEHGLAGGNFIAIPVWLALGVLAGTTSLGILAGVLPAAKAARVDPVEALASGG